MAASRFLSLPSQANPLTPRTKSSAAAAAAAAARLVDYILIICRLHAMTLSASSSSSTTTITITIIPTPGPFVLLEIIQIPKNRFHSFLSSSFLSVGFPCSDFTNLPFSAEQTINRKKKKGSTASIDGAPAPRPRPRHLPPLMTTTTNCLFFSPDFQF